MDPSAPAASRARPIIFAVFVTAMVGLSGAGLLWLRDGATPERAQSLVSMDKAVRACADRTEFPRVCAMGFAGDDVDFIERMDADGTPASFELRTTVGGVEYSIVSPVEYNGVETDFVGPARATCAPKGSHACTDDGTWAFEAPGRGLREYDEQIIDRSVRLIEDITTVMQAPGSVDLRDDRFGGIDVDGLSYVQQMYVESYLAEMLDPKAGSTSPRDFIVD